MVWKTTFSNIIEDLIEKEENLVNYKILTISLDFVKIFNRIHPILLNLFQSLQSTNLRYNFDKYFNCNFISFICSIIIISIDYKLFFFIFKFIVKKKHIFNTLRKLHVFFDFHLFV